MEFSVQFGSVAQSCPTLCDPMNHSTPGLPVHHQLPEFTQTHVHRVSDAIQPSHPQSSPSPPAPNPSQHQSLFQWVNSLHEVAKVLEFQLQHHSFQRNPRADLLQNGLVGSPCSPRDSQCLNIKNWLMLVIGQKDLWDLFFMDFWKLAPTVKERRKKVIRWLFLTTCPQKIPSALVSYPTLGWKNSTSRAGMKRHWVGPN